MRERLTYANVVATLALFLALSGGVVWAAGKIGSNNIKPNAVKARHIAAGNVKASDVAANAVGSSEIAGGAVGGDELAANSVTSGKIEDGAVTPADLSTGARVIGSVSGGSQAIPNDSNTVNYPLTNATWTQRGGEAGVLILEATATLDTTPGNACQVIMAFALDGAPLSFGLGMNSNSGVDGTGPVQKRGLLLLPAGIDTADTSHTLTATIRNNNGAGTCDPGSQINSLRIKVAGFHS